MTNLTAMPIPSPALGLKFWAPLDGIKCWYFIVDFVKGGEVYYRRWRAELGVKPVAGDEAEAACDGFCRIDVGEWPKCEVVLDESVQS